MSYRSPAAFAAVDFPCTRAPTGSADRLDHSIYSGGHRVRAGVVFMVPCDDLVEPALQRSPEGADLCRAGLVLEIVTELVDELVGQVRIARVMIRRSGHQNRA